MSAPPTTATSVARIRLPRIQAGTSAGAMSRVVIASLRYLVLTAPCVLGFAMLASAQGWLPFHGVLAGLVASTALSSLAFLIWMRHLLATKEAELVGSAA